MPSSRDAFAAESLKRLVDLVSASLMLIVTALPLTLLCAMIWLYDRGSPFYIATRVGRRGKPFQMVKLRSMRVNADKTGVTSTSADDQRITPVGHFVRRFKLDEFIQLWNVLKGDMSLVGPRPNVPSGVAGYTQIERQLLTVRPGVTDFASIVFSDEGDILAGKLDPDLAYNQLIRPGKSRLGLFYVENVGISVDLRLIWLTAVAVISRPAALRGVVTLLQSLNAPADLVEVARRDKPLAPMPPPGATSVVTDQDAVPA
jgi:lipopolysaccharide/colanic/teichoic acid biosynthesis glycosyltransferase